MTPRPVFAAAAMLMTTTASMAWDCHGHRAITLLALDGLSQIAPDAPAFLGEQSARMMAASNACEPDRYRSIRIPYMAHENNPDHYLDIEKLDQFGLTLDTVPPLRYEYLRAMAIAKHEHPDNVDHYNERFDPARHQEWPGYALHACMEHYVKLVAGFKTLRTLERLNEPSREVQLQAARANILFELGQLSHFVGDLAQPLHTTRHYNGWIGENPDGFTIDKRFHAYIDGDILIYHRLDYDAIAPGAEFDTRVDLSNPWRDVVAYIRRSHEHVVPLYRMQKSGELEAEAGRALIIERLQDGGRTLAAFYTAAWDASRITEDDVRDFIRYDRWEPVGDLPRPEPLPRGLQPQTPPAPPAPAPAAPAPVAPEPAPAAPVTNP